MAELEIRPTRVDDLPRLERKCWAGGEEEMRRRIAEQGTCSIVALDEGVPVGQLYIRGYEPGFRSGGLYDGAWWADLKGAEKHLQLEPRTAMLGCWHVGRVRDADGADREAPEYRGHGVGRALLEGAIDWLRSGVPFDALAAKAADCEERRYLEFLGGLPISVFRSLEFERLLTFDDPYFPPRPGLNPALAVAEHPARFHLVVLETIGA